MLVVTVTCASTGQVHPIISAVIQVSPSIRMCPNIIVDRLWGSQSAAADVDHGEVEEEERDSDDHDDNNRDNSTVGEKIDLPF
ncbi:unnamed protein product [Echinostoma caproni]|uniref:Secreted protein n=1 Tax=Echinostoma caproni TaxID=27848 RepID=A0A183BC54_9TREM|nr:unnamed protein product [Echinostoma caproni]